jgi:phenylacetate-coenzyme A ligase PaaK-like adenylate-forming protein
LIHITPSYALHLVEVIKENGINPHDLSVKKAYFGQSLILNPQEKSWKSNGAWMHITAMGSLR